MHIISLLRFSLALNSVAGANFFASYFYGKPKDDDSQGVGAEATEQPSIVRRFSGTLSNWLGRQKDEVEDEMHNNRLNNRDVIRKIEALQEENKRLVNQTKEVSRVIGDGLEKINSAHGMGANVQVPKKVAVRKPVGSPGNEADQELWARFARLKNYQPKTATERSESSAAASLKKTVETKPFNEKATPNDEAYLSTPISSISRATMAVPTETITNITPDVRIASSISKTINVPVSERTPNCEVNAAFSKETQETESEVAGKKAAARKRKNLKRNAKRVTDDDKVKRAAVRPKSKEKSQPLSLEEQEVNDEAIHQLRTLEKVTSEAMLSTLAGMHLSRDDRDHLTWLAEKDPTQCFNFLSKHYLSGRRTRSRSRRAEQEKESTSSLDASDSSSKGKGTKREATTEGKRPHKKRKIDKKNQ